MKMRYFVLFLLLASMLCTLVFASKDRMLVFDEADILTDAEESEVNAALNRALERTGMDIMVVTERGAYANENMARTEFFQRGLNEDGVILLVTFAGSDRNYFLYANGKAWEIMDDRAFDKVEGATLPHMREDRFEEAFVAYGQACAKVITSHGKLPAAGIALCVLIGAILSFLIPMNILKGQLKTVRSQPAAASYIKKNSMDLTASRDTFLTRHVSRVAKPQNNSSGGGSRSGGGGGGRGGSF